MYRITAEMIPNKDSFSSTDIYSPYKKVRKLNNESFVTKQVYLEIVHLFFLYIKNIILRGRTVELLGGLGELSVSGIKPRIKIDKNNNPKLPPDWGETRKLWERDPVAKEKKQLIFHFNDDSGFIRYKVYWLKSREYIDNYRYYSFCAARDFKREISREIKKGTEYNQRKLKFMKNEG